MLGFRSRNKDPRRELAKSLPGYELPSFPGVVTTALARLRDEEATPASVGEVLVADPGLSLRLLRIVNSAAFGLRRPVDSLDQAIAILGLAATESLVLGVAASAALPRPRVRGFDVRRFWLAAARRGAIARALAARLHPAKAAISFTAALVQDMAVPVLATEHADTYGPLLEQWHHGDEDLVRLERSCLALTHTEVATWMCSAWELPVELGEAIGAHHDDADAASCPPAVALVARIRESDEHLGIDELIEVAHSRFGLPTDETTQLVRAGLENAAQLAKAFDAGVP